MVKKAVVLLITIGFIGILSALILQTVTISKSSFDELINIKEENQLILLLKDIDNILKKQKAQDIKQYFIDQTIPIIDKKSGLNMTINCIDLNNRLDLNKLLKCKEDSCKEVVLKYLDTKELDDSEYFYKLLRDISKKSDNNEFMDDEVYQGDIVNFVSIQKVKDKYLKQIRDARVEKITKEDFKQVFYFFDKKTKESNISEKIKSLPSCKLLGFISEDSDECIEYLNNIKNVLNKKVNPKKSKSKKVIQTKDLVECSLKLYQEDNIHQIIFKYNLSSKSKNKIVSIDESF